MLCSVHLSTKPKDIHDHMTKENKSQDTIMSQPCSPFSKSTPFGEVREAVQGRGRPGSPGCVKALCITITAFHYIYAFKSGPAAGPRRVKTMFSAGGLAHNRGIKEHLRGFIGRKWIGASCSSRPPVRTRTEESNDQRTHGSTTQTTE